MTDVFRRTSTTIKGPFLLDETSLEALNTIIDDEYKRLAELRAKHIDTDVRRQLDEYRNSELYKHHEPKEQQKHEEYIKERIRSSYEYGKNSVEWTVQLDNGTQVVTNDYPTLKLHPDVQQQRPVKFSVVLAVENTNASVAWKPYMTDELTVDVTPGNLQEAITFFSRLDHWSTRLQPDRVSRLMTVPGGLVWFFWLFISLITLPIAAETGITPRHALNESAREMLDKGITKDNEHEAIELLLRLESEHLPGHETRLARWLLPFLITITIIAVVLSLPVRPEIAVGRGISLLRKQQQYRLFIRRWFPAFLIMGVLSSLTGSAFWEMLKNVFTSSKP
jgi:hypothetical protein